MMVSDEMAFGRYIEEKRKEQGITLRGFAIDLDIVAPYLSDIEKGKRYPPEKLLDEIARRLLLSDDDRNKMYDLAAMARENTVSQDLREYIMNTELVRVALRKARDSGFDDWQEVIDLIEKERKA